MLTSGEGDADGGERAEGAGSAGAGEPVADAGRPVAASSGGGFRSGGGGAFALLTRTLSSRKLSFGTRGKLWRSSGDAYSRGGLPPVLREAEPGLEHDEAGEEGTAGWHPVQGSGASLGVVERLVSACLRQVKLLPYHKKKRVAGLCEAEATLSEFRDKLVGDKEVLDEFQGKEELAKPLANLRDTLVLLSRKLSRVAKRRYFLDASYSKRMLSLHHGLSTAIGDLFTGLSRSMIRSQLQLTQAVVRQASISWPLPDAERRALLPWAGLSHQDEEVSAAESDDSEGGDEGEYQVVVSNQDEHVDLEDLDAAMSPKGPTRDRAGSSVAVATSLEEERKESPSSSPSPRPRKSLLSGGTRGGAGGGGEAEALYRQGKACLFTHGGQGRAEDNRRAVVHFARASQMGHTASMLELGALYESGAGLDAPDLELAFHFFQRAAQQDAGLGGGALALFALRQYEATLVPPAEALDMLREAARQGDPESLCALGEFYQRGVPAWGLERNPGKARALFAASAKQNHARAQNNLGVLLLAAADTVGEGLQMLEISAARGFAKAQNNLGMFHEGLIGADGGGSAVARNPAIAAQLYERAAKQALPLAMSNLAFVKYREARGMPEGPVAAAQLQTAAELWGCASVNGVADAHYYLGLLHESGYADSPASPDLARHHFALALERGSGLVAPKAAMRLGDLHFRRKHFAKARRMYEEACRRRHIPAFNALGLMHEAGQCDAAGPDLQAARRLYRAGHRLGDADATVNLALLIFRVDKDADATRRLLAGAKSARAQLARERLGLA